MTMLRTTLSELNLALTLPTGQAFRWKKRVKQPDTWFGVIGPHVVELKQDQKTGFIEYKFLNHSQQVEKKAKRLKTDDHEQLLYDYFQLDTPLTPLYAKWSEDAFFNQVATKFVGVRVLRQDPVECLLSFICSSNNNIKRITLMIEKMCEKYGTLLYEDQEFGKAHQFPEIADLVKDKQLEQELRTLGFGYRAKFIKLTAEALIKLNQEHKCDYLMKLREIDDFDYVKEQLIKLPGVGNKVADCVALFSLNKQQAIPVDTHVYQIAAKNYLKKLDAKKKLSTAKDYDEIANYFRSKFGNHAGWAHSVLFAADLKFIKVESK